ncbi:NUC130/3NT domain [Nesidiocoris tenuis]|uniref:Protein SDA1 n=1 Tax=Nesidiocoris tenuis TaxID=355587 RepID=A0ABN7AQA3_9HEMI|nr:NUC130/3NT domain [Nesidiocoris tenuis]
MGKRQNNQLPSNLPQLQNLIKRDPASYKDEFLQQQKHYKSLLSLFELHPNDRNKNLEVLVMFMSQVAHCYPDIMSEFAQEIMDLLKNHNAVLDPEMRMTFCRALILLRNKNLLLSTDLLSLFFQLLRSNDKALRTFLESHIINDIKNINAKSKNMKLNGTLQNFMFNVLNDSNSRAVKMSLNIMIDLYKKNVWNDAKTVNVIASACFSKITKVMVAALKFFLSTDEPDKDSSDDSDSEDEKPSAREVMQANKFNKKTRKREKNLKKVKQQVAKVHKKKAKAPAYNFSALHLVHDPQGLAEKLFKQLESTHERFEVKLMTLDVISRLVGLHQLILLNFYPYIQRFLQPHQKEVTKLLLFVAQACHELVPPDVLEPVLRTMVNNFVTERNSSDCMAIGLNAIREMCSRCPLAINEDLLRDLVQYKNYKDKSVCMAARSLIHLYRSSMPEMLHKKDRGKPTEASIQLKVKQFGEIDNVDYVPGAEALLKEETKDDSAFHIDESNSESDDDEWVDVPQSDDEIESNLEESEDDDDSDGSGEESEDEAENDEPATGDDAEQKNEKMANKKKVKGKQKKAEILESKKKSAAEVSLGKFLTDDDFKKIEAVQASKQIHSLNTRGVKRKAEEDAQRGELIKLGDIENIYKKKKHSKIDRIASVRKGQEGREKFGYKGGRQNPFASTTNREKKKTKNFMMIRHKARSKVKRSFKSKQIALRNYLIKQKKMR